MELNDKITELSEMCDSLQKENERLTELNRTKDKFFSIIAHDLRGPISSLRNLTGLLISDFKDFSDNEKFDTFSIMKNSTQSLFDMLTNLLMWSKIQTGRIEYNLKKCDINDVVSECLFNFSEIAHKKNVSIVSEINENSIVWFDPENLTVILDNLVSNALKYCNHDGQVKITGIQVEDDYDKKKYLEISVRDNGIGMDEDILNSLFRVDSLIKSEGTDGETGTGLGLIVTHEILDRNGGKIYVESKPDEGSSFRVLLPLPD